MDTEMITVFTTIILALITFYYACTTHKMMKYQKELTDIEKRPFLKLDNVIINLYPQKGNEMTGDIQFGVRLINVSRVLLKYKVIKVTTKIGNIISPQVKLLNYGGYVYPGQSSDFTDNPISGIDLSKDVIIAEIEYDMEYYSTEKKKYRSSRHYRVYFYRAANNFRYLSLYENEEEL